MKDRIGFSLLMFVTLLVLAPLVMAQPCVVPDNGTGTVNLPPPGCGYLSPDDVHVIIDGLPAGTTINVSAEHNEFFNEVRIPVGLLGGEIEQFQSMLVLNMEGTGLLAGFNRTLFMPAGTEVHSGPRSLGDPEQTFPTEMVQLQGELFGDPDFDFIQVRAGSAFGLPSPGSTTLTELPGGTFNVDSFFDITYQIDFQGAPGSVLEGMNGTTTGSVRMGAGEPAPTTPPCVVVDDAGTASLPPTGPNCGYTSPEDLHVIIDGLPPGTEIHIGPAHDRFFNVDQQPGGSLGGEVETFDSELQMTMTGTGLLAGFQRTLSMPLAAEVHTGPRNPGDPMQMFPNDMVSLQGEIFGDPDFDLLRITAGTGHGLPSPGQTTLTRLGNGTFNVDSFFDITYQIDFQGAPGSVLEGFGGTTTDTVRMSTGGPPGTSCPPIPAGTDTFPSTAKLVLEPFQSSSPPFVVRLSSAFLPDTIVQRGAHSGDTIQTEMVALSLSGSHPQLGDISVSLNPAQPSLGQITNIIQDPDTCELLSADSFFDVFVDIQVPALGLTLTPERALHLEEHLDQLPPKDARYENPFTDPVVVIDAATGSPWGQIVYHLHHVDPPFPAPGPDCFDSSLDALLDLPGLGLPPVQLVGGGRTTVMRSGPQTTSSCSISGATCFVDADCPDVFDVCLPDPIGSIQTDLVEMELEGVDPVLGAFRVRQHPVMPSLGRVTSQIPGRTYPADSFFDVFFEVELVDQGVTLSNRDQLRVSNIGSSGKDGVSNTPPDPGSVYQQASPDGVALLTPDGTAVGSITNVQHGVGEPRDWTPPPPPEDYCFDSWIHLEITLFNPFCQDSLWIPGVFRIIRGGASDPAGLGMEIMQTLMAKSEFLANSLCTGPLTVRLNGQEASSGQVSSLAPAEFFPADSFFDIWVELDTGIGPVTAGGPVHMATSINSLPPEEGEIYFGPGTVIPIYDASGLQIGEILEVSHQVHRQVECPADSLSRIEFRIDDGTGGAGEGLGVENLTISIPGGGGGLLYDVVKGDFKSNVPFDGTFATAGCFADDSPGVIPEPAGPALSEGFYYAAREVFDTFVGSWNSGGPTQAGDRDPTMNTICP